MRDAIVIGGLLAVFVLIAFLRDWRVTFIAATSLPLTLVGTFCILHLAGGTINLMSLGGLAIAIGLVIDDAIVVVENIHRHRAAGETVAVAAEKGTTELLAAVVGSTLTTVVVFVPLGLLQGVVGQFFAALSLTLAAAVLLSLVYALLFIPNAAARGSCRDAPAGTAARLGAGSPAATRRCSGARCGARRSSCSSPWRSEALGVLLYYQLETGFLPEMDEGGFVLDYWTPDRHLAARDRPDGRPDREDPDRHAGGGGLRAAHRRGARAVRHAAEHRRHRRQAEAPVAAVAQAEEVIEELRATFEKELPGMTIEFVQLLQDMLGDLEGNPEPIEVKIFGDDLPTLGEARRAVPPRR